MGMRNQTRKLTSRSNEYVCAFGLLFRRRSLFRTFPRQRHARNAVGLPFALMAQKDKTCF